MIDIDDKSIQSEQSGVIMAVRTLSTMKFKPAPVFLGTKHFPPGLPKIFQNYLPNDGGDYVSRPFEEDQMQL